MKLISKLFFLLTILSIYSQNEASVWYFGQNSGVDFSTGAPIILNDGLMTAAEGCATISDSNGNLLFYTNGSTVWDKNHNVMPNGTNLLGDPSATQSAIIIPKPDNLNIYYIFTVDDIGGENGLRYSEVDITLNDGNGDVTTEKNILVYSPVAEKITSVKNNLGDGFWLITRGIYRDDFLSFSITNEGVSTNEVRSTVGSQIASFSNMAGYMKVSPDGTKLAIAASGSDSFVEVFDFDSSSGLLTNPIKITGIFHQNPGIYGLEFSPNGNLLYVSDLATQGNETKVHQFNLNLNTQSEIINSDQVLYSGADRIGAVQLAIDEKIYLANYSSHFLDVIENPNIIGQAAQYRNRFLDVSPGIVGLGLPSIVQSLLLVDFSANYLCFGDITEFRLNLPGVETINWDFGDGNISNEINPSHSYENPGFYNVTVEVTTNTNFRVFSKEIEIYNVPIANTVSDYIICDDSSNDQIAIFNLSEKDYEVLGNQSPDEFSVSYFESFENATNHISELPTSYENNENNQEVFVKVYNIRNPECFDITSFYLVLNSMPIANSIDNYFICFDGINDGTINFSVDLEQFDEIILNNQSASNFQISYHSTENDAIEGINNLSGVYSFTGEQILIYYRIQNIENTNCFDVNSFDIIIIEKPIAFQANNLVVCDDIVNDNVESFNLLQQSTYISNGQTNMSVSYYLTEEDAISKLNPLDFNYNNNSNPQQIFARIESNFSPDCFDITSFHLEVKEKPTIELDNLQYLCLGQTLELSVNSNFDSYLWSTGETTQTINVNEIGTYSVMVENYYEIQSGFLTCNNEYFIDVVPSDIFMIDKILINDWTSNNNTIEIIGEGIGSYEYSIDGVNYQDSSTFHNLTVGQYLVYIRDKNGCGIVTEEIYLIYYPHVFTPNGDGVNDYWRLYNMNFEPNIEVSIFNRYGRLLKELKSSDQGWDGTLNGEYLPNSDYWFVVNRPNKGVIYRGHFSLKR